jgi:twitching motility protein PilT
MAAIHAFFDDLIKRGGTDLHFAVNQPPLARVRGEIVALRDSAITPKELEELLLELVSPAQRAKLAADLDLDLAVAYGDNARFRGSYFVRHSGIAATFRLVPMRAPALADLGLPEVLWRLADRRSGLVLVGSPAGNGRTTTIAAMLDHVNKTRACHIVTLENPIEFVHESLRAHVSQREIGTDAPSFAAALRTVPRENADVVYVSELSTEREVRLAVQLASDGLLVFAAVAASSAASAIERLLMTVEPDCRAEVEALLADGLAGVVVQHLVRAVDSKSRIPVHDILVKTPQVAKLIRERKLDDLRSPALLAAGEALGAQSLDAGLERLLEAGKITAETAFERAIDKAAFARALAP